MAEDSKIKIDKFDGHDFGFWKMQIEDYLYQKKLYEPLTEAKPTGMKAEDWNLLDRQALDEYAIRKKIIESKTTDLNTDTSKSKTSETVDDEDDVSEVNTVSPVKTNETQTVKTQVDKIGQTSQKEGIGFKKIKAYFVCKSTDHLIKDCDFYAKKSPEPKPKTVVNTGQRVVKPVWDNAKREITKKNSNKLKYPQGRRTFVPSGVLTRTGQSRDLFTGSCSGGLLYATWTSIEEKSKGTQATSINKLNTGRPSISTSNSPLVSTANTPSASSASAASTPTGANTGGSSFLTLEMIQISIPTLRVHKDHPKVQILGDPKLAVQTRGKIQKASSVQQALEEDIDYDEVFAPVAGLRQSGYFLLLHHSWDFLSTKWMLRVLFFMALLKRRLRATFGAELVSAASLVNTARSTLSTARLGKFGAARQTWCCQANLVLSGKFGAARKKFVLFVTVTTVSEHNRFSLIKYNFSMANLEFVDQYNMVAFLEKTEGNSDFHEIVNFLASSSIHHALTINATVDSKAVVVTEASIRSCLLFNDTDGTACLTNEAIFQNLALMGYEGDFNKLTFQKALFSPQWKFLIHTILHCLSSKSTSWNEFSTNIALAVICLRSTPETSSSHATTQDSRDSLEGTNGNKGDQVQTPHDSPLSGGHTSDRAEGALNLHELSILCTNLSNRVLALESIKDAQAAELSALKPRIKKLEKKCKPSISHHRAWLKSVSMKKRFGKKESVSKQGRKKSKPESTLDDSTVFDDQDADHGIEYMETEEAMDEGRQSGGTEEVKLTDDTKVVENKGSGDKGGNAEELVSTARPEVSTARLDIDAARQEDSVVEPRTPPKTTSIFDDEDITMDQTMIKMKEEKAKEKRKIARQLQEDLQAEVERERQREEEASKAAIAKM
ncbi:hypothetical protein Tco_0230813 [Tanacetum coccineum]